MHAREHTKLCRDAKGMTGPVANCAKESIPKTRIGTDAEDPSKFTSRDRAPNKLL